MTKRAKCKRKEWPRNILKMLNKMKMRKRMVNASLLRNKQEQTLIHKI